MTVVRRPLVRLVPLALLAGLVLVPGPALAAEPGPAAQPPIVAAGGGTRPDRIDGLCQIAPHLPWICQTP